MTYTPQDIVAMDNNTQIQEYRLYRWITVAISTTIIAMVGFTSRCSVEETATITQWERGDTEYIDTRGFEYVIKDAKDLMK